MKFCICQKSFYSLATPARLGSQSLLASVESCIYVTASETSFWEESYPVIQKTGPFATVSQQAATTYFTK